MDISTLKPITGTHHRVAFEHLHDSPTQPRTTYPSDYIQELTDSIKANGDILSDLMVRKRMSNPLRPLSSWTVEEDGFEVIFGHCRKRAGQAAGLPDAPVKEVEMTDEQVRLAQLAENLNRKDLTFLEEAETLQRLREKLSIDELQAVSGKSRTYVYNQLKLATASEIVKIACRSEKLNQELATLIARIPAHKLQDSALKVALEHSRANDSVGYRKTKRDLLDKYSLYLKDALWALDDAELVPSAGACTTCPSRSGSTPELYGDLVNAERVQADYYSTPKRGADICMNPECFALKKKTQLDLDARELASEGKTVVTGNAAKQALTAGGDVKGTAYVAVKDVKALLKGVKAEERPQTVLIQDQRTGKTVEAIKRSDLAGAGVKAPEAKSAHEANSAREAAERKKWDDRAAVENKYRRALLDELRAVMQGQPRSLHELRALAKHAVRGMYGDEATLMAELYGVEDTDDLQSLIETLSPDDIGMLLMDRLLVKGLIVRGYELKHARDEGQKGNLHELATARGINLEAHRAHWNTANGLSTPQPAAQAPKKARGKAAKAAAPAAGQADTANEAGAGAEDGQATGETLPLDLEQPKGQPASPEGDEFHTPASEQQDTTERAGLTLSPQAAWPFPKPKAKSTGSSVEA